MSMSVAFGCCYQVSPFKFIASKLFLNLRLSQDEGLASGELGIPETTKGGRDEVIETSKL
jgi:hypothetical protein